MASCLTYLINLLLILSCSARYRNSEWIEDAVNDLKRRPRKRKRGRHDKPQKRRETPPLKRQHPLSDMLDGIDDNTQPPPQFNPEDIPPPEFKTLDPLDILNENDYENNQFSNPLEMHDYSTQHSFQHPIDMISQNWVLVGDTVATTNFARYPTLPLQILALSLC